MFSNVTICLPYKFAFLILSISLNIKKKNTKKIALILWLRRELKFEAITYGNDVNWPLTTIFSGVHNTALCMPIMLI